MKDERNKVYQVKYQLLKVSKKENIISNGNYLYFHLIHSYIVLSIELKIVVIEIE